MKLADRQRLEAARAKRDRRRGEIPLVDLALLPRGPAPETCHACKGIGYRAYFDVSGEHRSTCYVCRGRGVIGLHVGHLIRAQNSGALYQLQPDGSQRRVTVPVESRA